MCNDYPSEGEYTRNSGNGRLRKQKTQSNLYSNIQYKCIRYAPDKEAEIFVLVINNTVECEWARRSSDVSSYITIDEDNLDCVLKNQPFKEKRERSFGMQFHQ